MTSESDRHKELEQRERILREREMEVRLREMETDIRASDTPFHQTVKHQLEKSPKPWMKKLILGGKLLALGVAVLVAVRIASVLAGIVIVAALTWISYKLFLESSKNNP
jgi:Protein of unknown function (DUF3040)